MQEKNLTFSKAERLCGEIRIDELFRKGEFFLSYPFRIGFLPVPKTVVPVRVLISVPKKKFKHAVDRNRIKRLTRENYRLKKYLLYDILQEKDYSLYLAVNYIADEILSFDKMEKKWAEAIQKIEKNLP
jgi:ribonuclease P protein component